MKKEKCIHIQMYICSESITLGVQNMTKGIQNLTAPPVIFCIPTHFLRDAKSDATPARPQMGKLVVACRWSAVYSTEP